MAEVFQLIWISSYIDWYLNIFLILCIWDVREYGHKFGWFYLMKSENEVRWNQKSLSEKILKFWWCANFYAAHKNDPFKYDCKRQLNQ